MPHPEVPSSYAPQQEQNQPLYFPGPMPYAGWAYPSPHQPQPPAPPKGATPNQMLSTIGLTAAAAMFLGGSVTAGYVYSLPQHQNSRQVHHQAEQFERIQEISCPTVGSNYAF